MAIPMLGTGETVHDLGCKLRGVGHIGLLRFLPSAMMEAAPCRLAGGQKVAGGSGEWVKGNFAARGMPVGQGKSPLDARAPPASWPSRRCGAAFFVFLFFRFVFASSFARKNRDGERPRNSCHWNPPVALLQQYRRRKFEMRRRALIVERSALGLKPSSLCEPRRTKRSFCASGFS